MTKQTKPTGLKNAASLTKELAFGCSGYVQVDYDPDTNTLYSVKHTGPRDKTVYSNDPQMIHVCDYFWPVKMKEIEEDWRNAVK